MTARHVVVALNRGALTGWHGGLLENFRAKGNQGDLLLPWGNYLQGRNPPGRRKRQASEFPAGGASVPQGSGWGQSWDITVDDLLQQLPAVSATLMTTSLLP
ncbi:hypothetical protein GWK47_053363 [Chionoecetes opilio]|uniref:Uncharacterized protein n=1 Tax=Chionoecetes opilio TaxID=41210 RepID=A0A8J4Y0N2_CHIOP|nr:hypothetical protein GWK47_053363 [Chionoecetes opilio]